MKKLEKLTLKELEDSSHVMSLEETSITCGGSGVEGIQISGATLVNYSGYCVYYGDDGSVYVFEGVEATECTVCASDTAYQWNGTISIEEGMTDSFDLGTLIHEYGHYLQQEAMGNWDYFWDVAVPSMQSVDDQDHLKQSYEVDATNRGYTYFNQFYGIN